MGKDTRPTERSQLPKEEGVTTFRPYSGFTRADRKKKKPGRMIGEEGLKCRKRKRKGERASKGSKRRKINN